MQNPWSAETYRGRWSDSSNLWTNAHKEKVWGPAGHTNSDDGIFYMQMEDYFSQASETYFNIDI